jgi:uncharacterized damage-inducible protein DinB
MHLMIDQFLQMFAVEHPTTMKVLQAVPGDQFSFKPHEKSMSAGELAFHIAHSQYGLVEVVKAGSFAAYTRVDTPGTLDEIVAAGETYYQKACDLIRTLTPEQLGGQVVLPGTNFSMPAAGLFWANLFHQIHHRGQLSVYIRLMGGKVPSIYGPSADVNPFA